MEDTLRDKVMNAMNNFSVVLILVLMEDTLRDYSDVGSTKRQPNVLILVLMEDTLRDFDEKFEGYDPSLNPCFNGRYS